ncbi:MAG: RraA family protein [Chloroflexi bacterium]|nr:RraA family protein [Chloroflexota bacterium]
MTTCWKSDDELFRIARRDLYTAVVGDILDHVGLRNQFLPPDVQPLREDMVVVGRAMTVLEADLPQESLATIPPSVAPKPFGLMLEALDDLNQDEVYVCTGASPTYAVWGELMSCRALKCGAAGAVLHGYSRDTRGILALGFPTFSLGRYAQDQAPRGTVIDFRIPIRMGHVEIKPGDIVFGDLDGVCVVPRAAEEEVFARAIEKARGEKTVKNAIQAGLSAAEAFAQYGIL